MPPRGGSWVMLKCTLTLQLSMRGGVVWSIPQHSQTGVNIRVFLSFTTTSGRLTSGIHSVDGNMERPAFVALHMVGKVEMVPPPLCSWVPVNHGSPIDSHIQGIRLGVVSARFKLDSFPESIRFD
jgi:hypothetical protein